MSLLSDIIPTIIENIQDDTSTLFNCFLVNRCFCRITVPLLWDNPFISYDKSHSIITQYIFNLNEAELVSLIPYNIKLPIFKQPLFNYPSYLKILDQDDIYIIVTNFLKKIEDFNKESLHLVINIINKKFIKMILK